jgi:uncharacterized membrane protein YphA (DoxX/SURF4 family)
MSQTVNYFQWTFGQKVAVRFFFLFFILYIILNPNGVLPKVDLLFNIYIELFHKLIPWIAKHILHLSYDITIFTNGSGDTTYDYVTLFFIFITSLIGCIIWSVLDRKRTSYNKLYYWLTVIVRYYAAFTMLTYGFVKVFKLQFPFPSLHKLVQPQGNASPMGLAWTFMGYSRGYNYFTGFAEVLGGLLLLFRRTTKAGAIVTLLVMGNVMAMNYCFDIPVKLLSTMVVIMSLFLMAKDMNRLIKFFLLNKPTDASITAAPPIRKRWLRYTLLGVKILLVGYTLIWTVKDSYAALDQYGDAAPRPPLYGIYDVQTFVKNNDTIPPLKTDATRWGKLVVDYTEYAQIRMINDSAQGYAFKPDTVAKKIILYSYNDTANKATFAYTYPEKDILKLSGRWGNDSLVINMKKFDLNNFRLVSRGFNWINEYPFNR